MNTPLLDGMHKRASIALSIAGPIASIGAPTIGRSLDPDWSVKKSLGIGAGIGGLAGLTVDPKQRALGLVIGALHGGLLAGGGHFLGSAINPKKPGHK